jgi:hypothetical protein
MSPDKASAVGLLIKDRIDLTLLTLDSLFYTEQDKQSYDLYLISNGSSDETNNKLKEWIKSGRIPVKNMVCTRSFSIAEAWNLFLALTKNYDYRIKLENDMVFFNTPVSTKIEEKQKINSKGGLSESPIFTGVNPGAVRNASIVTGAKSGIPAKKPAPHSQFIEHLISFSKKYNVGLSSFLPVQPGQPMSTAQKYFGNLKYKDHPYVVGGCSLITKECFDRIGYLDERLPRRVDIEYSQRAIRQNINVGYHDLYYVFHTGASQPTDSDRQEKIQMAMHIADTQEPVSCGSTKWTEVIKKINKQCFQYTIVNVN